MQIVILTLFFLIWLLTYWIGALMFESTGLERRKARFQALSALTGTGFTTAEAALIVNHTRRRKITVWLIFIGNAGILAFLILLVLYLRAGLLKPTLPYILMVGLPLLFIIIAIRSGLIDKMSTSIIRLLQKPSLASQYNNYELLVQTGDHGLVRLPISIRESEENRMLKDYLQIPEDFTVVALECSSIVHPFPTGEESITASDSLLCYGKLSSLHT